MDTALFVVFMIVVIMLVVKLDRLERYEGNMKVGLEANYDPDLLTSTAACGYGRHWNCSGKVYRFLGLGYGGTCTCECHQGR